MTRISIIMTLLSLILLATTVQSQNKNVDSLKSKNKLNHDSINLFVDKEPEFPGGQDSLFKFLMTNWKYHQDKLCAYPTRIHVEFIIEENGEVSNIRLLKPIEGTIYTEVVRVFKLMPKWRPAIKNGQPIATKYFLPIIFEY